MSGSDLSAYDPAFGKPAEFGAIARSAGRALNDRSLAAITGAENLLAKAARSTTAGQLDRAEQFIRRAAQMPYDEREEGSAGIRGGSLLIYSIVHRSYEQSGEDDAGWLEVALDVHARLSGPGKAEVASVIHGFVIQDLFFNLTPGERHRINQAVGDAPLEADLGDGPGLTVDQRSDIIGSLVAAAAALQQGYDAVGS